MKELLYVAREVAIGSGKIMLKYIGKNKGVGEKTSFSDLVTEADKEVDNYAISIIKSNFPGHSILTEESGGSAIDSDNLWVIDPIDGTNSFAKEFPFFAFSIAYYKKGVPKLGLVYSPMLKEMFFAVAGNGAYLNDQKISVSECGKLRDSLIVSGISHKREAYTEIVRALGKIADKARSLRITGSAALDICYVAKGIADGCYHPNLKSWDYAAAALILHEAGGKVSGTGGEDFSLGLSSVVASNGKIHKELVALLSDETSVE